MENIDTQTTEQPNHRPTINACAELFFEADRLNERAYAMLREPVSTLSIHEFSEAKKRAEEKYQQAWQQWLCTQDTKDR
ncbi:hypothetical protein [Pseudomonas sp. G(2018)]|uniref:hypothetical protein n=1 Tax=Pseudomonas sp. G(2018) TaxID=2502242 RepID=UPI0010F7ECA5|nr:hypothetical protein [Pseudomonas sp. G(2018)]